MGIGFLEICVIALFALIFFGPQRLPEMMREVGKFFVHAKRLSNEVKGHFETIMNDAEAAVLADEKKKAEQQKLQQLPPVQVAAAPQLSAPQLSEPHSAEAPAQVSEKLSH